MKWRDRTPGAGNAVELAVSYLAGERTRRLARIVGTQAIHHEPANRDVTRIIIDQLDRPPNIQ